MVCVLDEVRVRDDKYTRITAEYPVPSRRVQTEELPYCSWSLFYNRLGFVEAKVIACFRQHLLLLEDKDVNKDVPSGLDLVSPGLLAELSSS